MEALYSKHLSNVAKSFRNFLQKHELSNDQAAKEMKTTARAVEELASWPSAKGEVISSGMAAALMGMGFNFAEIKGLVIEPSSARRRPMVALRERGHMKKRVLLSTGYYA